MRRTLCHLLAVLATLALASPASAAKVTFGSAILLRMAAGDRTAVTEVSDPLTPTGKALEARSPFRLETSSMERLLGPGWYKLTLQVRTAARLRDSDLLTFTFQCQNRARNADTFRYETTFAPAEFAAPGRYGTLSRTFFVGPILGNYSMALYGFAGLRVESLSFEPLARMLTLDAVRTNKILYSLREAGTLSVHVLNGTGRPQSARLTVHVEGGLDDSTLLFDRQVAFSGATPDRPEVIEIPLPPQPEYGHVVVAKLQQDDADAGTARDYFYTTDRPAQVGHLGYMGIDAAYGPGNAAAFVEKMRWRCFPMYEVSFWAPDDALQLLPPPGTERWWSGQTLARMTTASLQERIRLGHAQGMKVLAYTDLRYDFGFRIARDFRRHPEFCEWDANNNDQAYSVNALRRQLREDDGARFDPSAPNKPKFMAQGVWRLASGNPQVVAAHVDQLVRSMQMFDWDGYRYDDRYNYDEPAVDLLGRRLPARGWRNPAIVARIRAALAKAKPGAIYGHNLEWAQDQPAKADEPMPLDTAPHANDYYTEFLRDGGLHLQERWLAHAIERHAPWTQVRDYLLALGENAYRRGGYAYGLTHINNARATDARHLVALHCASLTHLAGDILDSDAGLMRLACRHADLLYGDHLVPLRDGERRLEVDSNNKPLWWRRYVRYREIGPGHRVYLVHLINPPRNERIGQGDSDPPDPVTNTGLTWKLPSGWKATRAYQLSGEGDASLETVVSSGPRTQVRKDISGSNLVRRELPIRESDGVTRLIVPEVRFWSVVALDCRGPEKDVAPDVRFPLPAPPPTTADAPLDEAPVHSPHRACLIYDLSDPKGWTRPDPRSHGKRLPLEPVLDAAATTGRAAPCPDRWELEAYRPGEAIEGGTYRFSFRVKCTAKPPTGAKLAFSAWCPPNRKGHWRIEGSIPLDNLSPDKGWQTIARDCELGYGWENVGLRVNEGFEGLLIDQIKVEEVRRQSERERLRMRELPGWPNLGLTAHEGFRVWFGEGLYSEYYGLEDALRSIANVSVARAAHWTYRDKRGLDSAGWIKPDDLAGYDLVVLANIDLRTLPLEQHDWLRGYVEAGGALLLCGGPYGLGRGAWHESDLIEPLLPAKLHAYDLRPAGVDNPLVLHAAEGGFLGGGWSDRPTTLWLHEVEPKPGAVVQLKAGDRPALITGTAGKGRVAILTLTPLGEAPGDALAWWQWPGWQKVMAKTARWLLKQG